MNHTDATNKIEKVIMFNKKDIFDREFGNRFLQDCINDLESDIITSINEKRSNWGDLKSHFFVILYTTLTFTLHSLKPGLCYGQPEEKQPQ